MDAEKNIDTDEGLLKSMIALLLSLATIAERAAGRSYPVRCFLMWILRRGEGIARRHVIEADRPLPRRSAIARALFHTPEDALYLAALFRAAAHVLKGELREVQRCDRWLARREARMARLTSPEDLEYGNEPFRGAAGSSSHKFVRRLCRAINDHMRDLYLSPAPRLDSS